MEARRLWAGLELLDRQLVDRRERNAGKVDDVSFVIDPVTGSAFVDALLTGPGQLATRLGFERLGAWLRRIHGDDARVRVPLRDVATIGDHVALSVDSTGVGSECTERWTREQVVGRIPGSGHEAG